VASRRTARRHRSGPAPGVRRTAARAGPAPSCQLPYR
jgi:hypothetical protein